MEIDLPAIAVIQKPPVLLDRHGTIVKAMVRSCEEDCALWHPG